MTDADANDTTLRLERLIAVPREILFALWIEPEQLLKWWGPEEYETMINTLDVRPGGRWRIQLRHRDGKVIAMSGTYRIVEPPRQLSFTWAWENDGGVRGHETEVAINFETTPGGTRLTLVQQRFESGQARDSHNRGWSATFDRLTRVVLGNLPGT